MRNDIEKEALAQAEAASARIGGNVRCTLGTYDEAEQCYRLAQAIFSSMDDVRGEANELLRLGRLYVLQGRHDEAGGCFVDARVAYARIGHAEGEAEALEGLIGVHVMQWKFVDAKAGCAEAREIYARMGRPLSDICATTWELLTDLEQPIGSSLAGLFQS